MSRSDWASERNSLLREGLTEQNKERVRELSQLLGLRETDLLIRDITNTPLICNENLNGKARRQMAFYYPQILQNVASGYESGEG